MSEKNPTVASIIFAYLVVYIVWGSTFFFIEVALRSFPTFVLGSIRFIIAGLPTGVAPHEYEPLPIDLST